MVNRTKKACQECGKAFYGGVDHHYCPNCARIKKSGAVIRIRTCQDCGTEFFGGPRARRCPGCAYRAQLETGRRHKRNGTRRPIGSTDRCIICGTTYTVTSGRQKYCSDACQREGILTWQRKHKKGYSRASGQDIKKQERRRQSQKICVYCLRTFTSSTPTNVCSSYCRTEQDRLNSCMADIRRGYKRDLKKYEDKRDRYREECKDE